MTSARFDTYGVAARSITEVRDQLEELLGVSFEIRDSDYWGVYHAVRYGREQSIKLYENDRGEWTRPEYWQYRVILLINDLEPLKMEQIQQALFASDSDFQLLRSRVLELDDDDDES